MNLGAIFPFLSNILDKSFSSQHIGDFLLSYFLANILANKNQSSFDGVWIGWEKKLPQIEEKSAEIPLKIDGIVKKK